MSSETLLFEASWREGGAQRRAALVGRLAPDPAAVPVFPSYDILLAALRHGIVMFRISHRRMLERMVAGEYWE